MKKTLLFSIFLMVHLAICAQAVSWELSAQAGNQATNLGTNNNANFDNCVLSRGAGITATTGAGSMNASGWFAGSTPTTLAQAITGNDYYEFTVNTINCLFFNPTTIRIVLRSSATGPNTATLRCSSNGFTTDIGTVTVTTTSTVFTFSETISPNSSSVTYRLYGYGSAAGGGTPASGGTMRIGTSVVAADNDLEVFASTTLLNVAQVANITVIDGASVPLTVLTANVPGATINWSRTSESFGLAPTSGTGNIPAFTAFNASGVPITSTVSVTATVGNCTSVIMTFTITVNPAPCTITVDFFGNPSACNDNGTPSDPSDDFFTQNIHASFFNRPSTGNLQIVAGGDQIGTYSIPVNQIIGNAHTFMGVKLKADGTPSVVQMNFTDNTACIDAATGPTVQACSSAPASCEIIGYSFANIGSCNNNGTTNDATDDFFTVNIDVIYSNSLSNKTLRLATGDILMAVTTPALLGTNLTHTFTGVKLRANGLITNFSGFIEVANSTVSCSLPGTGPAVNSCSSGGGTCSISSVAIQNASACNDNGTNDPTDDFFTANVVVNFANPPATGNLQIEPGGDAISAHSIAVGSLVGTSHTFVGVKFKADGTQTVVEVEFTIPANQCTRTQTGPTVQPCSPVCDITSVSFQNVGACNNNGTVDPSDDFFTANVVVNFVNPPATGNLQIEPGGDAISTHSIAVGSLVGTSHTFVGVKFKADGTQTVVEVEFTIPANLCTQTQVGPTVQPCSFPPPTITCPANLFVSCEGQIPAPNISGISETHACPGTATIVHVVDDRSQTTCPNRFIMKRTYRVTDACGQTASCQQTITVNDQTPPSVTSPPNVTVQCIDNTPDAMPLTATDNCDGSITVNPTRVFNNGTGCANSPLIETRTWVFVDRCGNTRSVFHTITVIDQTPPSVSKGTIAACFASVAAAEAAAIAATTATDNCSGAVTKTASTSGTCSASIIVTGTDRCGNSASVTYSTRIDNTPPSVTKGSIADCFLTIGAAETAAKAATTATDNCGGTLIKTAVTTGAFPFNIRVTVTDQCNNSAFVDYTLLDVAAKGGRVTLQNNTAATSITLCPSQNAVLIPINFVGKVAIWQYSPSTSSIWYDLPGTEGQLTLTVNGSTVSGTIFYRAVICSGGGVCTGQAAVAFSNAFRITKNLNCTSPDGQILPTDITADNRLTIHKAYPNPATDMITFEIEHYPTVTASDNLSLQKAKHTPEGINEGVAHLEILDVTGRQVLRQPTYLTEGFNSINVDISKLSRGIFVVKLTDGQNQKAWVKIVKE